MAKYNRGLTLEEIENVTQWGYAIATTWIGPLEGWEYRACVMGRKPFNFSKSPRAAYNAILRHRKTPKPKKGDAAMVVQGNIMRSEDVPIIPKIKKTRGSGNSRAATAETVASKL